MPAPTFRANSSYVSGTGSITLTFPTGYQVNDILVLALEGANQSNAQAHTNLTNNGWARVANSNVTVGTLGGAQATKVDVWWQRATSQSQTAVSITDFGDHTMAVMSAFYNVPTSGSPWDTGTAAGVNVVVSTASAQVTFRNVTTTVANTLVLNYVTHARDSAAAIINAAGQLFINSPSGDETNLTKQHDLGTTSGGGGAIALLTFRKPSAGQTGNLRVNVAAANVMAAWTGALIGTADAVIRPRSQVVVI
jgi:hypothetical protein